MNFVSRMMAAVVALNKLLNMLRKRRNESDCEIEVYLEKKREKRERLLTIHQFVLPFHFCQQ